MNQLKTINTVQTLLLCGCLTAAQAEVHHVVVQDNNFSPANISIEAGDSVRWENFGAMNHNAVSTDLNYLFRCADGCEDTGGNGDPAGNGWVAEVTFHKPDSSIPYVCEPHVGFGMTGSISVQTPDEYETINISDSNGFVPQNLTITQQTRVLFIKGSGAHNVYADDDSFRCADGCRDDGVEGIDDPTGFPWQFFKQFNELGTFTYHCQTPGHNESGVITVVSPLIFANGFESL
jgi:plastocyanin